ncbi:galactose mutarotase [Brachybacterium endophyticum]|uniref:Galactose mutarotase n=1 Tax=Brachybacterium endophyticum TaxID=2182385 RepID=A0A2U2RMD5_9MICO|nr:aldose 1-epimerase family protein [Brachybacterium endophyticum]PWH06944.1 galactose mutarotase [Brachybacterium endophyticum]
MHRADPASTDDSPAASDAAGPLRERGALHRITAGPYVAEVSEVGATLEGLTVDGRDLLLRSPDEGPMLFYRGAIVAPWPNRIGDGLYTWDGEELQVPITEVERHNALHGLLSFQAYEVVEEAEDAIVLGTVLYPTTGYPFTLEVRVEYRLEGSSGLTTTVRARNRGRSDAPYGVCPHPYLLAGPQSLEEWTVVCPAATVLEVSEDRLLPTGTAPVDAGSDLDLRSPRPIDGRFLDHAFTDLAADADGRWRVRAQAPGGTGVEISADERCPWVQVHTGDRPEAENNRKGLAVEPMTCPPDAFRTGTDVVRLAPGAAHEVSWSIRGW